MQVDAICCNRNTGLYDHLNLIIPVKYFYPNVCPFIVHTPRVYIVPTCASFAHTHKNIILKDNFN